MGVTARPRSALRWLPAIVSAAILLAMSWAWWGSRLPDAYSVTSMGTPDWGLGLRHQVHQHAPAAALAGRPAEESRPPDVVVDLTATQGRTALPGGRRLDGFGFSGRTPGPPIVAEQGDLVEVRLSNDNVADGTTLHWHGLDVPNAQDGVAGVTQDAVMPGKRHVYRFVAEQAGTFWYHSHQVSHPQVLGGLIGVLVVVPATALPQDVDATALVHTYGGRRTINGVEGATRVVAAAGESVRVRVINTDPGPMPVWVAGGAPYRVVAVDGTDVVAPTIVRDRSVTVTAGGRVDVEVGVPQDGDEVRVQVPSASVLVGPGEAGPAPTSTAPSQELDLLGYGSPAPLGLDPGEADRHFRYAIGRRPGFLDGRPGMWWTINGRTYPDVPMFMVRDGDVVTVEISNGSGEVHPMHLHGHHVVVLSRNGVRATGSPWWVDSLNVEDGETYVVAFVADNPGVWMDHCHNLKHPREGLMAHLMYEGVTTPFLIGGTAGNHPE